MPELVSKCGINCGACPWGPYPRQNMSEQDFETFKNTAKRILGYMPIRTACVTCQTPDAEIPKTSKLPSKKCLIRQCVDQSGIENCGYCSCFPCDTLKETAGAWNQKTIETRLGVPLSDADYHTFVEPFEGLNRLTSIHSSLKPDEIVEPAKVSLSTAEIVKFPENLKLENVESFKAVYRLLSGLESSSFGLRNAQTFAQQHKLETFKAHVFRFLWIVGNYGKPESSGSSSLVVDVENFFANRGAEKRLAIWAFVEGVVFRVLSDFGVCCERVACQCVKEKDLTTGTGYLRNKGWFMRVSFTEKGGGLDALNAFQVYSKSLGNKYGKKAFQHFRVADMTVLSENTDM